MRIRRRTRSRIRRRTRSRIRKRLRMPPRLSPRLPRPTLWRRCLQSFWNTASDPSPNGSSISSPLPRPTNWKAGPFVPPTSSASKTFLRTPNPPKPEPKKEEFRRLENSLRRHAESGCRGTKATPVGCDSDNRLEVPDQVLDRSGRAPGASAAPALHGGGSAGLPIWDWLIDDAIRQQAGLIDSPRHPPAQGRVHRFAGCPKRSEFIAEHFPGRRSNGSPVSTPMPRITRGNPPGRNFTPKT